MGGAVAVPGKQFGPVGSDEVGYAADRAAPSIQPTEIELVGNTITTESTKLARADELE